jgi:predicted small lipoprotein YifL
MRRTALGVVALALVTGLAGCGSSGPKIPIGAPAASTITPVSTGNPYADLRTAAGHMPAEALTLATGVAKGAKVSGDPTSNAADLRARLTALLTEHVYLAGAMVATLYHFGDNTPQVQAAETAVDTNATDLAAIIGTVSPAKQSAFLDAWRAHDVDFLAYANGAKANDDTAKHNASNDLLDYAKNAGQFFSDLTGGSLSASGVQADFVTHIASLTAAIDAMAASTPDAFSKLKTAADHMADSAQLLASGVARSANVSGDSTSPASKLRADLTGLLTSHVYLTGLAVYTGYSTSGGTDSNAFTNATDTLDTNSQDLATVLGAAAGKDKQDAFLQVWRAHVDDFVAYAKADAADDAKGRNTALSNLDAYRTSAGKFFADLSDGALNADDVAAALKDHVATLAGAIDSLKVGVLNVPVVIPTSTPTPTDLSVFGGATSSSPSPSESSSESASPSVSATPTASAKSTASITGHSH